MVTSLTYAQQPHHNKILCIPIMDHAYIADYIPISLEQRQIIADFIEESPIKIQAGEVTSIHIPKQPKMVLYAVPQHASPQDALKIGGSLAQTLIELQYKNPDVFVLSDQDCPEHITHQILLSVRLRSWRFHTYKNSIHHDYFDSLTAISPQKNLDQSAQHYDALYQGVCFGRELVSEPANILYPEEFAKRCLKLDSPNLTIEILGEKEMAELGMGALLGVGQGSIRESKMVIMHYNGCPEQTQPIAFVGKGVCFDTGGISLKPGPGMEEMIWDMAGAGAVAGAMKAIAQAQLKVNIVGVCGLVENMPDGNAQRPGDIVKTMKGLTVDIHNTDAEGRLVLADALHYTKERFNPSCLIDLATLTGAIIISLGHEHAGLMSNNDILAHKLLQSGQITQEKLWQLPLHKNYDKMLDSPRADMKNIGGKAAGSIVAAHFLQRFVDDTPWAHLDIAGVAWSNEKKLLSDKGATGFGVRLLYHFATLHVEHNA